MLADPLGRVLLEHLAKALGIAVDAPHLVRPRDERAMLVPAVHPRDAVVEPEEARLDGPARGVGDRVAPPARLVLGLQEMALQHGRVADWDGLRWGWGAG